MSRADSSTEAEAERSASASLVAQPNEVPVHDSHLLHLINELDIHDHETPDFHHRFVVGQYHFPDIDEDSIDRYQKSVPSATSSMALTDSRSTHSSAISSYMTPSLAHSGKTLTSGSSVRTDRADSVIQLSNVFEIDDDGTILAPRTQFPCLFHFLGCIFTSAELEEWDIHCKSHLGHKLPGTLDCPYACDWSTTAPNGEAAWAETRNHMSMHIRGSQVLSDRPPSLALLQHLYRARIIDADQMQELRQDRRLGNNVLTQSAGYVSERRRERRSRARSPRGLPSPRVQ